MFVAKGMKENGDKMTTVNSVEFVKSKIRDILDFPVKGIVFKDITTVLRDKEGFKEIIDFLTKKFENENIDYSKKVFDFVKELNHDNNGLSTKQLLEDFLFNENRTHH